MDKVLILEPAAWAYLKKQATSWLYRHSFSFLDHFGSLLDAERIIEPSFLFWSALESSSFRQW